MKYSENKDYKVIAVVMASFYSDDQQELIKRITKRCEEYKCRVVFFSTVSSFYEAEEVDVSEKSIFDVISVECFDAILLMAETFKAEKGQKKMVQRAIEAGVPVLAVDHYMEGCINLSFEYTEAFRKVVKHMVEYHGYRTINFFSGAPNNSFSDARLNVFKEVLAENNIPYEPDRVYYGYFWEDPTVEAVEQMLRDRPGLPDAIICANDTMALTVCDCLQRKGYRVPQDVTVSGFDGIHAEKFHYPRLLTCKYDIDVFLEAVFGIVNDPELKVEEREVFVNAYDKMQIGGSCGCKGMKEQNASAEIIRLKSNMYEQMDYQTNLGQMVANYGSGDSDKIVYEAIPHQIRNMWYYDFWCCTEYQGLLSGRESYVQTDIVEGMEVERPEYMNVVQFHRTEEQVEICQHCDMATENLLPDLSKQLDAGIPLLVVVVPSLDDPMGYSVISFDEDRFWYKGYASFIFHLRFLYEMMRNQKELMKMYRMDSLTGIYNRNGFYAKMDQLFAQTEISMITVISMDMYQFKLINDTYGHAEGDYALETVGKIIRSTIKENEIAARNGGDEFLIVLHGEKQEERTKEIVTSLVEKANQFNENNTKDYKLIFSIGVCTETAENHSLDYFLREADGRMYEHKNAQRIGRILE